MEFHKSNSHLPPVPASQSGCLCSYLSPSLSCSCSPYLANPSSNQPACTHSPTLSPPGPLLPILPLSYPPPPRCECHFDVSLMAALLFRFISQWLWLLLFFMWFSAFPYRMYAQKCIRLTHTHTHICSTVLGKAKANKANGNSDAPAIRMQFQPESIEARNNTQTRHYLWVSAC